MGVGECTWSADRCLVSVCVAQNLQHCLEWVGCAGLLGKPMAAACIRDQHQAEHGCLNQGLDRQDHGCRGEEHYHLVDGLADKEGPHKPVDVSTELLAASLQELVRAEGKDVGLEARQTYVH